MTDNNRPQLSEEDISLIKEAVANRKPIEFYCYTLTPDQKIRFQNILKMFLEECGQDHLVNCLSYCLLELLDNASKANAKRIFFQENKLDINNKEDYENGMKTFRKTITDDTHHYMAGLKEGYLQVYLRLSANDFITLKVLNNTKITNEEKLRIQQKIENTKNYNTLEDAFKDIDQTEGSGLGIVSIILILKRLGLDTSHLNFNTTDNETVATIKIPIDSFEEL